MISPQWRCQQFSSILCDHLGIDFARCEIEKDLREHSFGFWEGLTEEEIERKYPGMLAKRYSSWWEYIVPGGESYELLYNRVKNVLEKYSNQNVIFVCHEMVSKVMRGNYKKMKKQDILKLKHSQDLIYKLENKEIYEVK